MSKIQDLRCRFGLHRWGPVTGDDYGGHQTCEYCDHTRRVGTDSPPEAHDHMGLNR